MLDFVRIPPAWSGGKHAINVKPSVPCDRCLHVNKPEPRPGRKISRIFFTCLSWNCVFKSFWKTSAYHGSWGRPAAMCRHPGTARGGGDRRTQTHHGTAERPDEQKDEACGSEATPVTVRLTMGFWAGRAAKISWPMEEVQWANCGLSAGGLSESILPRYSTFHNIYSYVTAVHIYLQAGILMCDTFWTSNTLATKKSHFAIWK